MIVKNEEDNLGRCLSSVDGVFDEINIVDTGSTDKTVEIAKQFTDRVFHFDWVNDFSAARNFSFSKATMEYVMWLDADDVISDENRKKIIKLKSGLDKKIDCVYMKYNADYDENGNVELVTNRDRQAQQKL
jgi:glycosyltransferase involved in cell wall biosynthesis